MGDLFWAPRLRTAALAGDIKNLTKGAKIYFPVFVEGMRVQQSSVAV